MIDTDITLREVKKKYSIFGKNSDRKRRSTPGYIGAESIQFFYDKYKNFEKEEES